MPGFTAQTIESLREAVAYSVRYDSPDENGETRVQRNERFGQGDKTPERAEYPDYCMHVVEWFSELGALRPNGFNGPERIGWSDIAAWSGLTGNQPLPEEVDMLIAMDGAYIDEIRKEQNEAQKAAEKKK